MRSLAAVSSRPRTTGRRAIPALLLAAALGIGGGSVITATPSAAAVAPGACTVDAADLTWGFKESFRSYISGTIANGEWQTDGGASYTTPSFSFTAGTGDYAPDTATGAVSFLGAIHFTGHEGLLQTSVSAPTLQLTGPGSARLLLDISSVPMDQALAGDNTVHTATQVPFVEIDLTSATVTRTDADVTIAGAELPTAITPEGFAAFGNYDAGTAFDPIALTVHATCAPTEVAVEAESTPTAEPSEATAPAPTPTPATATPVTDASADSSWVPWAIGGGVVVLLAAAGTTLLVRRRSANPTDGDDQR
ncbi:HtaA domain-containing protein [Microbacterium sp. ZW T5_56]|uniref:HtaA domain-containing protein n=1 Tax=Microbacterium sp. ZW T5_56 TaxID=3378081 RepID=UPI0038525E62